MRRIQIAAIAMVAMLPAAIPLNAQEPTNDGFHVSSVKTKTIQSTCTRDDSTPYTCPATVTTVTGKMYMYPGSMQQHVSEYVLECTLPENRKGQNQCPAVQAGKVYPVEIGQVVSGGEYKTTYIKFLKQPDSPKPLNYDVKSVKDHK